MRQDYDEIKNKFGVFISIWKNRQIYLFENIVDPEVLCFLSIVKEYPCGSQHSSFGIKNFIQDIPRSDIFHSRICNFVCRIFATKASQYSAVTCFAASNVDDQIKTFEFTAIFSNIWEKKENGWVITEIRMDIVKHGGNFEEFYSLWYFEDTSLKWSSGMHYPRISGEFDSPWKIIPVSEDVLNEEEKILETLAKYNFGVDHLAFSHVESVLANDFLGDMPPWGPMNKRHYIECLKFHRQKDLYWAHPVKPLTLMYKDNMAFLKSYRMAGHNQRNHSYEYTKENLNIEHACGRYELVFQKEDGIWKIKKWNYYLGLIELDEFIDDLYGE